MSIFVIAEGAGCHDGSLEKAYRLADLAFEIGADAIKLQWCSNPELLCKRRNAPEYLEAYKLLNFPREWHRLLAGHAGTLGIEYLCTVYIPEDIPVIAPFVQRFKVASFEAEDMEFKLAFRPFKKEIIASEGMAGFAIAFDDQPFKILHCVSAYPTPIEEINLSLIRQGWADGLSDHTKHPLTGAFAVCAGAQIIEFHVRLNDTSPKNADYAVARTREEARVYVENIRTAELMLGDGVKRVMPSEESMMRYRVRSNLEGFKQSPERFG